MALFSPSTSSDPILLHQQVLLQQDDHTTTETEIQGVHIHLSIPTIDVVHREAVGAAMDLVLLIEILGHHHREGETREVAQGAEADLLLEDGSEVEVLEDLAQRIDNGIRQSQLCRDDSKWVQCLGLR